MKKLLTRNLGLKLASLLLAFVTFWIHKILTKNHQFLRVYNI